MRPRTRGAHRPRCPRRHFPSALLLVEHRAVLHSARDRDRRVLGRVQHPAADHHRDRTVLRLRADERVQSATTAQGDGVGQRYRFGRAIDGYKRDEQNEARGVQQRTSNAWVSITRDDAYQQMIIITTLGFTLIDTDRH